MNNSITVTIQGGLGKVLCASAALRGLRKKYPDKKIIVLSGWSDIFMANPNVDRAYSFNENKYLYEDFVKDGMLLTQDPYNLDSYRLDKVHLAQAFCEAFNVEYDGNPKPDVYIPESFVNKALLDFKDLRKKNLPIIVIQPLGASKIDKELNKIIPTGRENVALFHKLIKEKQDKVLFIVMKTPQQPNIGEGDNVLILKTGVHFLQWAAYISLADAFIGVDSSGHHMAAAFNKPSIVMYGRTDPKNLSYSNETVVDGECEDLHCNGFLSVPLNSTCKKNYKCVNNLPYENLEKPVDDLIDNLLKYVKVEDDKVEEIENK